MWMVVVFRKVGGSGTLPKLKAYGYQRVACHFQGRSMWAYWCMLAEEECVHVCS